MPAFVLVLVLLSGLWCSSCSVPAEQPIVSDFFAASRLRDLTLLSRFATVVFEPRVNGTVAEFEIQQVGPVRQQGDMQVKEVTVAARVRTPDGKTADKRVVLTLQKRTTSGATGLYGGWMITRFDEPRVGSSPTR